MRIHIIGGPGSGKSYAAKKLSLALHITSYLLDDLFWDKQDKDFTKTRNETKRDAMIVAISKRTSWITEGSFTRDWISPLIKKADIIIIITPNKYLRALRIFKRSILRRLKKGKIESFLGFINFLRWNNQYDSNNLIRGKKLLRKLKKNPFYFNKADKAIAYVLKNN